MTYYKFMRKSQKQLKGEHQKVRLFFFLIFTILFIVKPDISAAQIPAYSRIVENVRDCVVSIVAMTQSQQAQAAPANPVFNRGTGIVISDNGYIATNDHIVTGTNRYFVELSNSFVYEAELVGRDFSTDIAVLKVGIENHQTCEFMDDVNELAIGELVLAIGSPFSLPGSVSVGIVSYINRPFDVSGLGNDHVLFIQSDLIVNPGNSGGPLVNEESQIIGMNSATFRSETGTTGIAFAIPSSVINRVSRQLIRDGVSLKGYIGVEVNPLPATEQQIRSLGLSSRRGALVSEVDVNGPAYQAGIRVGDIVLTINRVVAEDDHAFRYMISTLEEGDNIRLSLVRNGSYFSTDVTVEGRLVEN